MICLRHLISSRAVTNRIFLLQKKPFFLHTCAACSDLPSNLSTMRSSLQDISQATCPGNKLPISLINGLPPTYQTLICFPFLSGADIEALLWPSRGLPGHPFPHRRRVQQTIYLHFVFYKAGSNHVSFSNQKDAKIRL